MYDINLIPKVKKKVSGESIFITTALCLCCFAFMGFFGFYLPIQQKLTLSDQIRAQEDELQSYSDTQDTYTLRVNQLNELKRTDIILNTLKTGKLKMTKIMNDIEMNIPQTIILQSMSFNAGLLTIEGTAPSYQDIAEYIVNLRSMENVLSVTFMNAIKEETMGQIIMEEESSEVDTINQEEVHSFTIYVNLFTVDVISDLLSQQVADQTGKGGIANEIN